MTAADPLPADPRGDTARRRALLAVTALVLLAGIGYGAYWALVLNHFETTDNAYVQGQVVQITPQVGGTVVAIGADDTDRVAAGQLLLKLDPADARVALDQAEAQLAQTVREVRTLYANNGTLQAQITLRQADLARTQSELARAQDDVARRAPLLASGAVGQEEYKHATAQVDSLRSSVAATQSALAAAREQLGASQVLTDGIGVEQHPSVQRAAARLREAWLALHRMELRAPVEGYVARRNVQLGQRVQAGAPLMSVVALGGVWVEANFKESQLQSLRIGQPVELVADVYGKKVRFDGSVQGLGAGTGAAFALLPAQNATGNWIKVVQRVPVRISVDPKALAEHPLRVGLSMEARVDVSHTEGRMLAEAARAAPLAETHIFDADTAAADAQVHKIIAAHSGHAAGKGRAAAPRNAAQASGPATVSAGA